MKSNGLLLFIDQELDINENIIEIKNSEFSYLYATKTFYFNFLE